jgi:hypothetical protein
VRPILLSSVLLGCLTALACGDGQQVDFFQPVTQDPAFPGTPGDPTAFQNYLAYTPDPSCNPNVPRVLDRRTEVRIFTGNDIPIEAVTRFVGGLKRYFDHYGVTMYTRYDVISVPIDHAIVLNEEAIMDWMRDVANVDPQCLYSTPPPPSTSCLRAMGGGMFYNVKQFLKVYAEPMQNVINIVLLKRVAALDPSTAEMDTAWGVAGLGLSQELLDSTESSDLSVSLTDQLDETDFSPTVFIGVNLIDFVLPAPDVVIAHEFGHAYGLEHTKEGKPVTLMTQGLKECAVSLDLTQLSTIEKSTARYGNVLTASRYSPLDFLSFNHRASEITSILRDRIARRAQAGEAQ